MKKKILAIVLAAVMVFGTVAAAAGEYVNISVVPGMSLRINGQDVKAVDTNGEEVDLFAYNGTTYAPIRYIAELLGLEMGWNEDEPTVAILNGTVPGLKAAGPCADGTYTGTAMGFGGPITVEVTIAGGAITGATVTGEQETPDVGGAVLGRLGNLIKTQGQEFDAVTGATYTSRGAKDALGVALAKAQGATVEAPADGKYTIEAIGHEGIITVSTMFKDGEIKSVTINSQSETEGIGTYAIDRMPSRFVPAQSFNVDAVGGATVSSAAIRQGVAEAIILAGGDPALFAEAPAKAPVMPSSVKEDVDVVIAGAGTAGLLAAARLLEAGVENVVLFEKQDIPGGSMAMAFSGFNGTDSQIWKNWSVGRSVNTLMSTWEPNEEIGYGGVGAALLALGKRNGSFHGDDESLPWLKQMYTNAGKLYDWMTSIGVGFYTLGVEPAYTSPYFSPGCYSGGCGYAMEFFVDRIAAKGGRIIYNTEVTELIQQKDGTVTGVKAVGKDGKNWTVNAKATMLATGGFTKNKELLEQYHSAWANESFICPESLTGDGLRMGLEAGGVVDYADAYMPGFLATYNSHFELAFLHYMKAGIMVNVNGDEFANILVDNHATMAKAKADPANGNTFYYVFDDAGAATIKDFDSYKFTYKGIFEKGEAIHYNSVEEAAATLNLPNLAATIEANNGYAMAGTPNAFGMAGTPYLNTDNGIWLVRVEPVVYLTTAGLRVDIDGRVLTEEDEPITNLWAAGDVIGSYEQRETRYGNGFDAAVSFGALVGDHMAEAIKDTYSETALGMSITAPMNVNVTIKDGKVTSIAVGTNDETPDILQTVIDNYIPRIIENQSLAVDAIGGATASSVAVRSAVEKAVIEAGGNRADWYKKIEKKTETVKLEGYDVIVVGLGGSGMASYVSAAENGAVVFGLETAAKIGGTSAQVSGPMAINPATKIEEQKPEGGKFLDEEELIADWLEYCRGDAKEDMVRLFVTESGETMDWLINDYGFKFGNIRAFFHPKMWPVWASYSGSKTDMMTNAVEKAKAMNEKNDYMLELTGEELIVEDGEVVGVKATYWDGTTYEIYGKSVILATGGFMGNAEMTEKYMGGTFNIHGMTQNDGDGINMGLSVGAALYNVDMPGMVHMANYKNIIRNDDLNANQKAVLAALAQNTSAPIIGINGVAFMETSTNLAFDNWKGGDTYFVLYTQADLDTIKAHGLASPAAAMRGQGGRMMPNTPVEDLDEILAVGEKTKNVFKAGSLSALAFEIGVDADALKAAAPDMAVGPFYAVAGAGYYYGTCGGLEVDTNLNVVKTDGTPIANLYAVGQDSMGVLFSNQDAYVTYGGAAQGWVLTSGRLAGANAAAAAAE